MGFFCQLKLANFILKQKKNPNALCFHYKKKNQTHFLGGEKTGAEQGIGTAAQGRAGWQEGTPGEQGWGDERGWRSSRTGLTWLKKAFSREKGMRENQKWGWMSGDHQEHEITREGERKEQREV